MTDPVVLLSTGDVVGPNSVTDGTMVLFDGTSGKLIKGNNAVVTTQGLSLLDDVDAAANRATIGLNLVNNTSDVSKPISTAQQTALDLKAPLLSPAFQGGPTVPTATAGTNNTIIASTAFVATFGASLTSGSVIGIGQTWKNLTDSRVSGTTYTNSTGKPIFVSVGVTSSTASVSITINGVLIVNPCFHGAVIIPNGATYVFSIIGEFTWSELS